MSKIISRKVVPIGTSMSPELFILPVRANTFVPLDLSVPMEENQLAPRVRTTGTLARVSTLLITVGLPQSPFIAGNGGFGLGIPRFPSID